MRRSGLPDEVERVGRAVLDAAFHVHTVLGPALRERYYVEGLTHVLETRGHRVVREARRDLEIDGLVFHGALRVDLVVDDVVLVEVKAVETILEVHRAQALSYLHAFDAPLGYLLNFRTAHLRDGIQRFVNTRVLERKG
jgi:GxxExxY protein